MLFCAIFVFANQLVRLVEDKYFSSLESSLITFSPYIKNYDIPIGNRYSIFIIYLIFILVFHIYRGKLHDFRLETGKWLFTAGLLGNGFSMLFYGNVIDYIGLPSWGIATNLPDISLFIGGVFYSFGVS